MSASLLKSLSETMDRENLWPSPGDRVVLAVSGGLDSCCMARLLGPELLERSVSVRIAHADHGLRPLDAQGDRAFVAALAEELGVDFVFGSLEVSPELVSAVGIEAAARHARMRWLEQVAAEVGAESIFVAHHRDDQVETILLRRAEGLPVERACGMRVRRGRFVRPLLDRSRAELERAARTQGWSWREDPSNADVRFARNRLRRQVIPSLAASDPHWEDRVLGEGAEALMRRSRLDARIVEALSGRVPDASQTRWELDREPLERLDGEVALGLLQRLCSPELAGARGPSRAALEAVVVGLAETSPGRTHHLGAGWSAWLDRQTLVLVRGAEPDPQDLDGPEEAALGLGETLHWNDGMGLGAGLVPAEVARRFLTDEDGAGTRFAIFDAAGLQLPLQVCSTGSGRSMRPFGMTGHRPLRDLLSEAGVQRAEREHWPVVSDASGAALWLPGIRSASHAPLQAHSERAVMLYTVAAFGYDPTAIEMSS